MTETAIPTERHRMSAGTIVWAIMVLVVAGLAFLYFATDPKDITPTVVLTYAVMAGAALVATGILGAIVKAIADRRGRTEPHPPIG